MQKVLEGFDFKIPDRTFGEDDYTRMAAALGAAALDNAQRREIDQAGFVFMALYQRALIRTHWPFAVSDGHDLPWLLDEFVPGFATQGDNIIV